MTFDPVPAGTGFSFNSTYEEHGILATCKSHYASFGDPLNGTPTTALYFHGTGEYVEFSIAGGGSFDLVSFELVSNGYASRWIETSRSGGTISIGQPTTLTLLAFSGPDYSNITWFRVGTPWYATEIDNVSVSAVLVPPIVAVYPANGAMQVPTTTPITVTFSEAMDATTLNAGSFLVVDKDQNTVSGVVTYDAATLTASFAPSPGLSETNTYRATVTTSVRTASGTPLPIDCQWSFSTVGMPTLITQDTVIDAANPEYEGRDLAVDHCTLTVSGHHSLGKLSLLHGAVLTHPGATIASAPSVDLALVSLHVDATSRVDVKGKGYLGARRGDNASFLSGRTTGNVLGSGARSGGGHGGNGGGPSVNPAYGDFADPQEPGSGGGSSGSPNNYYGDNGGGVIRIAAPIMILDGTVTADGNAAAFGGSGAGSGGSIRFDVGTLSGVGTITARGGDCPTAGGAGGGGRIAIYYEDATGFDFAHVTAPGGANTPDLGGPGSVFLKAADAPTGELLLSGAGGTVTWLDTFDPVAAGVTLSNQVALTATNISVASLSLRNGSVITTPNPTASHVAELTLQVGSLSVDATSRLDASGKGFLGARRGDNASFYGMTDGYALGSPPRSGGSYGGLGGGDSANPDYGDFSDPSLPGSGGGGSGSPNNYPGENGGGIVRIAAQNLALDGLISADGSSAQFSYSGAGSGGSVRIDVTTLSGAGRVTANGGNCAGAGGAGGGGRIAIYYENAPNFDFSKVSAQGGANTPTVGTAGTVYLKESADDRSLALNTPVLGRSVHPHGVQPWHFTGLENQQFRLQDLNASAPGIHYSLMGPGRWYGFKDVTAQPDFVNLPTSGTYTLLARSTGAPPSKTYTFRLQETVQTELAVGSVFNGNFAGSGQAQLFRVRLTASKPVRIVLSNPGAGNINELYARFGALPTRGAFDHRFDLPASPNQQLVIDQPYGGDYYVLVYGSSIATPGGYTLEIIASDVIVRGVSPSRHGNSTAAVLTVDGAGFEDNTQFALVSAGGTVYSPTLVAVESSRRLEVTLAPHALPPGRYSVRVSKPGGDSDTLPEALEIVEGGTPKIEAELLLPAQVGRNAASTVYLEYSNTGDAAMPAPLLVLEGSQNARLTIKADLTMPDFWTTAEPRDAGDIVQVLGSGAVAGLLQPGETVRVPVHYLGLTGGGNPAETSVQFRLGSAPAPGDAHDPSIDWAALKEELRPPGIAPEAWTALWDNFTTAAGPTLGSYQAMLRSNADYLGSIGFSGLFSPATPGSDSTPTVAPQHVGDLLAFEFAQADGLHTVRFLASSTDGFTPTPGLRLSLERVFPNRISGRYQMGAFGRGWSHNWETRLERAADGTITVVGPAGARRTFKPDARGGYFNDPGDYATLTALGGDIYRLREKDGLFRRFRADGKLDYVEDLNATRITCGYSGNDLASLTHSPSGRTLQLTYAGGRLETVTDPVGRQTAFSYTGDHLTSARYFDGSVVTYSYASGQGPAREHTLTEIAYPGGTHEYFSYNPQGRLDRMSRDGGAGAIAFAFDNAGLVAATDAVGNTSRFYLDHRGLLAKVENPYGSTVRLVYDERFNLTRITDPAGHTHQYAYDGKGNLLDSTDPVGNHTRFAYAGPFQRLSQLTDAKTNLTRYTHDAQGNLTAITYANDTVERWAYDTAGSPVTWTNRRSSPIQYQFNASGQLTEKLYPDGSRAAYEYDPRGNLIVASNYTGRITLAYDAHDRLRRITYPGDRWLQYTYNEAGQRASMTDQLGYRLDYEYDAVGRLRSITNSAELRLVLYEYDAAGRLERKTLGNGVFTTYGYDAAGQLLTLTNARPDHSVLSFFNYTYDTRGRRTAMATHYGAWTYEYDDLGQLTHAVLASTDPQVPDQDLRYEYDAMGNRLRTVENGVVIEYAVNAMNQYDRVGAAAREYDADGNQIQGFNPDGPLIAEFDAENRLVALTQGFVSYLRSYDAFGATMTETTDGQQAWLVTDPAGGGNLVAEFDTGGNLLGRYDHGYGLLSSLGQTGNTAGYTFDGLGSVTEVTTAAVVSANCYAYDPFGALLRRTELMANRFRFVGEYGVASQFNGLYSMRSREYSADLARISHR